MDVDVDALDGAGPFWGMDSSNEDVAAAPEEDAGHIWGMDSSDEDAAELA